GPDMPPVVSAPPTASGNVGVELTVNVQVADPNTEAISSLTAEQLPAGAVFTPAADHLSGTMTWTPAAGQDGSYTVTFRGTNALQAAAQTVITITSANQAPTASLVLDRVTGNEPLFVTA